MHLGQHEASQHLQLSKACHDPCSAEPSAISLSATSVFQIKTEEAMYFKWEGGSDRTRRKPTVKTLIVNSFFLDNFYFFIITYFLLSFYLFSSYQYCFGAYWLSSNFHMCFRYILFKQFTNLYSVIIRRNSITNFSK